ncbi:MAG TPA: hypothetical protein VNY24_15295 [Candidatus Acidoferrales bacterium]|nr:hypothetical protein [Candidatus Acidoferrales bacterium]
MNNHIQTLYPALFLICSLLSFAQPIKPQSPQAKSAPSRPKVEMAAWSEKEFNDLGITKEAYLSMGLEKLTAAEYKNLLDTLVVRDFIAESKGKTEGRQEAASASLTYSCGPPKLDEASVSKVSIFVESSSDTPAELMSGVRQRLRNIPDVQIVFEKHEADLVILVLGFQDILQNGQSMGYIAATTVKIPCLSRLGGNDSQFEMYQDGFLQATAGKSITELVELIVTTLDSKDIEVIRKENAIWKKSLQNLKK